MCIFKFRITAGTAADRWEKGTGVHVGEDARMHRNTCGAMDDRRNVIFSMAAAGFWSRLPNWVRPRAVGTCLCVFFFGCWLIIINAYFHSHAHNPKTNPTDTNGRYLLSCLRYII